MTISDDLISQGILGSDPDPEYVNFPTSFRLKRTTVDSGGLDKFAQRFGWNNTIKRLDADGKVVKDADGNALTDPNPKPSYVACGEAVQKFIRDVIQAIVDYDLQFEVKDYKVKRRNEKLTELGFPDEIDPAS